jgi:hypothetical protein
MGTPHKGSSKATLGKIAASAGKIMGASDRILRSLQRDSDLLEQQRNSFYSIRRHMFTVCLWEELPLPFLGIVRSLLSTYRTLNGSSESRICSLITSAGERMTAGCGAKHQEWFQVDVIQTKYTVSMWKDWVTTRPYDEIMRMGVRLACNAAVVGKVYLLGTRRQPIRRLRGRLLSSLKS